MLKCNYIGSALVIGISMVFPLLSPKRDAFNDPTTGISFPDLGPK